MKICTFFGHRDSPNGIEETLNNVIRRLIETDGVIVFYVGNHGQFDLMVHAALRKIWQDFPQIQCAVVLAYLPNPKDTREYNLPTIYPAGLENVLPRFAILQRNLWMLQQSDVVVSYVAHSGGGAAQFCEKARRQGKTVINLFQA